MRSNSCLCSSNRSTSLFSGTNFSIWSSEEIPSIRTELIIENNPQPVSCFVLCHVLFRFLFRSIKKRNCNFVSYNYTIYLTIATLYLSMWLVSVIVTLHLIIVTFHDSLFFIIATFFHNCDVISRKSNSIFYNCNFTSRNCDFFP